MISPDLDRALARAAANIEKFHQAQAVGDLEVMTEPGVLCEQITRPIDRVGIYVPGGTAPLFSTVLMLGIPAKIAGCREIVVATPPQKNGKVHPTILTACERIGIKEVLTLGGVQGIAALAFGSAKTRPVNKIFGPGNAWVTEAKRCVQNICPEIGIDLPAGPSELLVIADETADARVVAWDLLSQAEHGEDSQVILVSNSEQLIYGVLDVLAEVVPSLPRKGFVQRALEGSRAVLCQNLEVAVEISNSYGPEHLIINTKEPRKNLARVRSAGSVFLGPWAAESMGDYASGTNHVLPTSGAAHFTGGVSLSSFLRKITVQSISPEGLGALSQTVETMALSEGLYCHAQAVVERRNKLLRLKKKGNELL